MFTNQVSHEFGFVCVCGGGGGGVGECPVARDIFSTFSN